MICGIDIFDHGARFHAASAISCYLVVHVLCCHTSVSFKMFSAENIWAVTRSFQHFDSVTVMSVHDCFYFMTWGCHSAWKYLNLLEGILFVLNLGVQYFLLYCLHHVQEWSFSKLKFFSLRSCQVDSFTQPGRNLLCVRSLKMMYLVHYTHYCFIRELLL